VTGDAGLAVRAGLPEQGGTGIDPIHCRIDEGVCCVAILDRLGARAGSSIGLENFAGVFRVLRKATISLISSSL